MSTPAANATANPEAGATQTDPQTPPAAPAPAQQQPSGAAPPAEPPKADQGGSTQPPATETPPAETKVVPETYDLKLPDGSLLDAQDLEALSSYAKEKGLTQAEAQEELEREHKAASSYSERMLARQQEGFKQQAQQWRQEVETHETFGGAAKFTENEASVDRVLNTFAPPELSKVLAEQGLRYQPALYSFLLSVAKATAEDKAVLPGSQSPTQQMRAEDILYPSMRPKQGNE
jgi:hypothetical protein